MRLKRGPLLSSSTGRMALVAIDAVVNVVLNALMVGIRLALGMTIRAGENGVVIGIRVAGRTNSIRVAVIGWEPSVVEDCTQPRRGVVAGLAGGREPGCDVVWIVRSLIIRLMAAVASRW